MRLRAGGPRRGVRLARLAEGRRLRFFRQSQPSQPQTAALGCELRRTRQFGSPRALGGLVPAVPHIGRHHTLSHDATRTARRKLKRRLLFHHSYLCRGAATQEGNEPAAKFCGELLYCNHRSPASSDGRGNFKVQPLRSHRAPFRARSTVLTHATLMASDVRSCCGWDHHQKA